MQHFISEEIQEVTSFNITCKGSIRFKIVVNDGKISIYHLIDEIISVPFPCKTLKKFDELWYYFENDNSRVVIKYKHKYLYIGSVIIKYYIDETIINFCCLEEKNNIKSFLFGNKHVYYLNNKVSMNKKYFIADTEPNNLKIILLEFQKKSPYQKNRHLKQIDFCVCCQ